MNIEELLATITAEANAAGVSPDLAKRIFGAENFKGGKIPEAGTVRTDLVSPKGAQGVFQIMPDTQASLERMGLVPKGLDPMNPAHSVKLGIATLKESLSRTGDEAATIAEYDERRCRSSCCASWQRTSGGRDSSIFAEHGSKTHGHYST